MIDALRGDVEMKERDRFLCESATDSARALSAARETRPWAMTKLRRRRPHEAEPRRCGRWFTGRQMNRREGTVPLDVRQRRKGIASEAKREPAARIELHEDIHLIRDRGSRGARSAKRLLDGCTKPSVIQSSQEE